MDKKEDIIKQLILLANDKKAKNDTFRYRAYMKAITALKDYQDKITSSKDLDKVKGLSKGSIKEKIIEIQTTLNLSPKKENFEKIDTKIIYSTIIELDNKIREKKEIEKIILIKVPFEIYPELRKIFVFLFENSGFKEVKISENVDFQKLYDLRRVQ